MNEAAPSTRKFLRGQETEVVVAAGVQLEFTELEARAWILRLNGHTYQEIGDMIGKGKEWARQIVGRAERLVKYSVSLYSHALPQPLSPEDAYVLIDRVNAALKCGQYAKRDT